MIAILTYDLFQGRERLMPWKTVLNFAQNCKTRGVKIIVYSIDKSPSALRKYKDIDIVSIRTEEVSKLLSKVNASRVYIPITKRSSLRMHKWIGALTCDVHLYYPGSIYPIRHLCKNLFYSGLSENLPYFIESVFPYYFLSKVFDLDNVSRCYVFSVGTESHLRRMTGSNKIHVSRTGYSELSFKSSKKYSEEKYLIAFGGPSKLRGWKFLIASLRIVQKRNPHVKIKILLRNDKGFTTRYVSQIHKMFRSSNNIDLITEELSRESFFREIYYSHAVLLPFLLIPSEIPISYHELVGLGKRVLSIDQTALRGLFVNNISLAKYTISDYADLIANQWDLDEQYLESSRLSEYDWNKMTNQWLG